MRMRSIQPRLAVTVLVPLAAAACQESVLEPNDYGAPPRFTRGTPNMELPFRMSGGARLVAQQFAPGFPGGTSDFDGRCSAPSHFVISFTMDATAAHLGRLAGDFEHCSLIDFQTGASTLADGVALITASNGDELRATYRSAAAPQGDFDEALTFVGGTGRFENASGEALGDARCNRDTGTCTYEARGTLVYDASGRSGR